MIEKITRIFRCENGHEYESKESIISSVHQLLNFMLDGENATDLHCNDFCKICGAKIITETNYINGKPVMGAALMEEFR